MAGQYLLGRIHKVPATVYELAQAERRCRIEKRQGQGLRGKDHGYRAWERFCQKGPKYENPVSTEN